MKATNLITCRADGATSIPELDIHVARRMPYLRSILLFSTTLCL
jgi:hypothetical protein